MSSFRDFPNGKPEINALQDLTECARFLEWWLLTRDDNVAVVSLPAETFLSISPNKLASDAPWWIEFSTTADNLPTNPAALAKHLAGIFRNLVNQLDVLAEAAR